MMLLLLLLLFLVTGNQRSLYLRSSLEHDVNAEKVNVRVVVGQMEADRPTLMAQ